MATCIARLPPSPSLPLLPRRQMATMKAGFGSDKTSSSSSAPKGWTRIADLSEIPTARRTLPVEVSSVLSVMLYLTPSGRLFCTDANSTAFKFPLTDAIIAEDDAQTTIEVPLDGTIYDLETGEVISWCPQNTPLRFVLGKLKESVSPEPLKVYPVRVVQGGGIFADFRS